MTNCNVNVHRSRLRKIDTQLTVVEDMETQQDETQQAVSEGQTMLPHSGFKYENCDMDSVKEMASVEERSPDLEHHNQSEQDGCAQTDTLQTATVATPKRLQLKAGKVVTYTDIVSNGKDSWPCRKGHWKKQRLV